MFDIIETTIQQYHDALLAGETSCEAVVSAYLDRIRSLDNVLRSVIHLNPQSVSRARELDQSFSRRKEDGLPPLFGVPVVLKDTYATYDTPTTVGSKALVGLRTKDAFVVRKLREAGAIVLGKTNCTEYCLGGITSSSLGGQTLNPYDLTRTPGGSSGGTGAAVAANLAMVGCGGDTMNSIRSPASACNVIGLRPSAGQISRSGIFPVTFSQDAIGPMARNIEDVCILFDVMRGEDPQDAITVGKRWDQTPTSLSERRPRLGILEYYFPEPGENEDAEAVLQVMDGVLRRLKANIDFVPIRAAELGAAQVDIEMLLKTADVQRFEFAAAVGEFLTSEDVIYSPHKSLRSIAQSGDYDKGNLSEVFYQTLELDQNTASADYKEHRDRMELLYDDLAACLDKHRIDAVIFPHQRRLVMKVGPKTQPGRNGLLAALTGCPSLCIPAGFSPPTEDAVLGVPVGMEIVGRRGADLLLLEIGRIITGVLNCRKPPALYQ